MISFIMQSFDIFFCKIYPQHSRQAFIYRYCHLISYLSENKVCFLPALSISRYVGNSPTNFTDPSGEIAFVPIAVGVVVTYAIGQAFAPDHAQAPMSRCDYHPTPPTQEFTRGIIEIGAGAAPGAIRSLGNMGGYAAPRIGNTLGNFFDHLNPPGLVPAPVGGGLGNFGGHPPNLSGGFGPGLGQSASTGAGTAGGGLAPNFLQSNSGGITPSNSIPAGAGGTGTDYDKVSGQGLYVLKDGSGNVKYVGRGDAPTRLDTHANSLDKGSLKSRILFDNNRNYSGLKNQKDLGIGGSCGVEFDTESERTGKD